MTEIETFQEIERSTSKVERMQIHLQKDIYSFMSLLIEHKKIDKLSREHKFELYFYVLMSFLFQVSILLFILLINPARWTYITDDDTIIYNCRSFVENDQILIDNDWYIIGKENNNPNVTLIEPQKCNFQTDSHAFRQDFDLKVFFAKIFASLLIMSYIASDIKTLIRAQILIQVSNSKCNWTAIFLYQLLVLVASIFKMMQIISNQDNILDVLTGGISFILLLQIDNIFLENVISLYNNGKIDDLFIIDIDIPNNSLYKYIKPGYVDIIMTLIFTFAFVGCVMIVSSGMDDDTATIILFIIFAVAIVSYLFPLLFMVLCCCKRDS